MYDFALSLLMKNFSDKIRSKQQRPPPTPQKKSGLSTPLHQPKCVLMWKAQAATVLAQAPLILSPGPHHSKICVQCRVFLKIILCFFKMTPLHAPLKQDLNVIYAEFAVMPDYCICSYEHPAVKNIHTYQRINVRQCVLRILSGLSCLLCIFFHNSAHTRTQRCASVKILVSLPGINRLVQQRLCPLSHLPQNNHDPRPHRSPSPDWNPQYVPRAWHSLRACQEWLHAFFSLL